MMAEKNRTNESSTVPRVHMDHPLSYCWPAYRESSRRTAEFSKSYGATKWRSIQHYFDFCGASDVGDKEKEGIQRRCGAEATSLFVVKEMTLLKRVPLSLRGDHFKIWASCLSWRKRAGSNQKKRSDLAETICCARHGYGFSLEF